mgnify:CR=1 FL=1
MKYRHFPAAVLAAGLLFCTLFSGLTAYADDKKGELTQKQTETRQEYEAAQSALERPAFSTSSIARRAISAATSCHGRCAFVGTLPFSNSL